MIDVEVPHFDDSSRWRKGNCDICGKTNVDIVLAESPLTSEKYTYCKDCLYNGIERYEDIVTYLASSIARIEDLKLSELPSDIKEIVYSTMTHNKISAEELVNDVKAKLNR